MKTERNLRGYASANCGKNREMDFENWQKVDLPHDFIITQEPKPKYNNTPGYFKYDNARYRKIFKINGADSGKRLSLFFKGVAPHATFYLNGCLMAHNFCGYTSFEVDITDMVIFYADNALRSLRQSLLFGHVCSPTRLSCVQTSGTASTAEIS